MRRDALAYSVVFVGVLAQGAAVSGCRGSSPAAAAESPSPTARIYDDFLESRRLAASLTSPRPDLAESAREQKISEDRKTLRDVEAGVASKRALLADAHRDVSVDSPNESLYFRIWSGHDGDGDKPTFRRLAGGGIDFAGKQFTKEVALRCAVPSQLKGYTHKPFLDCLTTLPNSVAAK